MTSWATHSYAENSLHSFVMDPIPTKPHLHCTEFSHISDYDVLAYSVISAKNDLFPLLNVKLLFVNQAWLRELSMDLCEDLEGWDGG